MIDLHLHTTASDGSSTPEQLVAEAAAAGIRTLAVTDHDTVAAVPAVRRFAAAAGLACIAGIEITAVANRRDVHLLGYFLDITNPVLNGFLEVQRADRRRRLAEMVDRLVELGKPIDASPLLAAADAGQAVGRPMVADALVRAGWAEDMNEAFARDIGEGCPAYVERRGASPSEVIALITQAQGLASLAHPGKLRMDAAIPDMANAGLAAIEVFHPDHAPGDVERYAAMATALGVLVTGGSDYHGASGRRAEGLGRIGLSEPAFAALAARAANRSA